MNAIKLEKPIIGLAPMDGVTDAAYRYIQKKYGNPDILFTEFTNVIGLCMGIEKLFIDQTYSNFERPIIAQVFGNSPEHFYEATKIIMAMGFDGIDINMGCPARKVADKGSGAGLIQTPKLAKTIIQNVKKAVSEFLQETNPIFENNKINEMIQKFSPKISEEKRLELIKNFTVSVKTRIGYNSNIVSEWMKILSEEEPDWITVHGRTLRQLYSGISDPDALAEAVSSTDIPVIVNGDVKSSNDAVELLSHTKAMGVLIGRASYGNPWIFQNIDKIKEGVTEIVDFVPSLDERFAVMRDHAAKHVELKGESSFIQLRKNFGWYCKGFLGASLLRSKLVRSNTINEMESIIKDFLSI